MEILPKSNEHLYVKQPGSNNINTMDIFTNGETSNVFIKDVGGYDGTDASLSGAQSVATVISDMNQELDIISSQLESFYCYGIEFDTTVSSPSCTRIGNMTLHRTLPVQSKMRGCLLSDNGEVNEYLPDDDWTTSTRDGSMGQVMVEIPEYYRKCETEGTKRRVWISDKPVQGYTKVPISYVSAYEAALQRSTTKLASVVNMDPDYRGGGNQSSYDGTYRTMLGRPVTAISRTSFRNYARKRKQLLAMLKTSPLNTICEVHENESGLHFLLKLHTHLSEEEVQTRLAKEDMRMQSLSDYYMDNQKNQKHMYIIHYSNLVLDDMSYVFQRIYELVHD